MIRIKYPAPDFKTQQQGDKQYIFDGIRKIWLLLTEEEWVRQNFVNYLIMVLKYPSTLIALEKVIVLNDMKKRFDILIYDQQHQPWMLVECKASTVSLSEKALQQILRYNISVPVNYMIITNGDVTFGWKKEGSALKLLHQLPSWP